jgi:DNA-binding phage protein
MPLTRDFKTTVQARVARDPAFRDALLAEALNAYLSGDMETGKTVLRDFIKATIGFDALAAEVRKSSKSLHRMLAPNGNPTTGNFFALLQVLQQKTGVRLEAKARHG